jgi:hypothetical protein
VNGKGNASVLTEIFYIGEEYIGEYITATIDTKKQSLDILYYDKEMIIRKIKRVNYKIDEKITIWINVFFLIRHIGTL